MTKLVMQQAPTPAMPRRFLLSASLWGMVAGALLVLDDGSALASRWGGGTLALVHAFTLGVLGNAMFGSLLQFLPVAVQVRVRGGHAAAALLHALLNAGAALLVVALRWPALVSPHWGGAVLGGAFLWLLAILLPGLWAAGGQRFLRWGMGCALLAALVTAGLGVLLVLGVAGTVVIAQPLLTDVHAGWGVLGWVLGLLAAVARVVAPMFQGARPAPLRMQGAWQVALYGLLLVMLMMALAGRVLPGARIGGGLLLLAFALGGLLLQVRAGKLRRVPLTLFWRCGLLALAAAAGSMLAGDAHVVLAGVLVLAIGLPLLVTGMQLEITGFLGWIELQRRCGRGVHLPGVHALVPARDKWALLGLQLAAGLTLVMACLRVIPANGAGVALLLAHAVGVLVQCAAVWRARQFERQRERMR